MIAYHGTRPRSPRADRRRRCRECHAPATHVEVEQRPAAALSRDGSIRRFVETVNVYWCDQHTGIGVGT